MTSRLATTNGKHRAPAKAAATVRVQCQADNPDPKLHGTRCGSILADIPATYRFVGLAARRSSATDGRIRVQCKRRDCRTWNIFDGPHE